MAGRWERLALEAHCRHALDFATEGGPYRKVKEEVVFSHLEDQLAIEVMELAHAWHVSAAGSDIWDTDGKTFEYHRKECSKIYRDVGKLKLPWYKRWMLDDSDVLVGLIKQFYAQERDPAFREWREKTKKEMRDKIESVEQEQETMRKVSAALKQSKLELEKKAREADERRKERARHPARR